MATQSNLIRHVVRLGLGEGAERAASVPFFVGTKVTERRCDDKDDVRTMSKCRAYLCR